VAAIDDALAIRRRQKTLADVPVKERATVAALLRKTALLGHHEIGRASCRERV